MKWLLIKFGSTRALSRCVVHIHELDDWNVQCNLLDVTQEVHYWGRFLMFYFFLVD